jgi:hypothetical protein
LNVVVVVCAAGRGPERQIVLQVFGCFMFASPVAMGQRLVCDI